jgi:hypothetical protein
MLSAVTKWIVFVWSKFKVENYPALCKSATLEPLIIDIIIDTILYGRFIADIAETNIDKIMYVPCNSCNKEFNDLSEGVRYSSSIRGLLWFCSDDCCKNYLNRPGKGKIDKH